jgi:hypothetical protein
VYVEAPIDVLAAITVKCRFRGVPWIARYDPSNRYQFKWAYDEPIAQGDLARIQTEHDRMKTKFQNIKDSAMSQTDQEPAQKNNKMKKIMKNKAKTMKKIMKNKMTMKIKNKSGKIKKTYKRRRAISAKSIAKINKKLTKAAKIAAKKSKAKEIKKNKGK